MCKRGGYLMRMLLLLALAAGEALPHQKQQQQPQSPQRISSDGQHLGNDYGPIMHISSAVLQLVPDELTHLELSGHGSGGSFHPYLHGAEPRLTVSDNLDFQVHSPQRVQSHGR
ncbi:uncharacterized protein [Drosophila virilis]|uniref:Uncharacterized protein n=1 Tax=Drosophila virilis TaxID=7244 RepID=B4MEV3_DROVI|nr:uncharacterized protein LOC6636114 [Drosophila virilis]EDW63078.1 uncharacterized protein Dvir_GJ14889 [Drosophila virilis]